MDAKTINHQLNIARRKLLSVARHKPQLAAALRSAVDVLSST